MIAMPMRHRRPSIHGRPTPLARLAFRATLPILLFFLCLLLAGASPAAEPSTRAWPGWATPWPPPCSQPAYAWQVEAEDGRAVLFGSIHFAKADTYPLCPEVERAFAQADMLVVELDAEERAGEIQQVVLDTAFYPPGDNLMNHLSEENKARLKELGLDGTLYQQLRPWYFALLVQVQELMALGYAPQYGLDLHFLHQARDQGMKIVELESVQDQMGMLQELAAEDVQAYVSQTLDELESIQDLAGGIFTAWNAGDDAAMEKLLFEPLAEHPEYAPIFEKLYFERNQRMARAIGALLEDGRNFFVVVGAGHLTGPRSVLAELQGQGYTVTRLPNQ